MCVYVWISVRVCHKCEGHDMFHCWPIKSFGIPFQTDRRKINIVESWFPDILFHSNNSILVNWKLSLLKCKLEWILIEMERRQDKQLTKKKARYNRQAWFFNMSLFLSDYFSFSFLPRVVIFIHATRTILSKEIETEKHFFISSTQI